MCPADNLILRVTVNLYQMGMSARNHEAEIRRLQLLMFNIIGSYMPLDVMYTYQRLFCGIGYSLCLCHSYQKSTHKSGTVSHTYGIYVIQCLIGILKCGFYHLIYLFNMLSRSYLWYHATVQSVQVYLGIYRI